MEIGGAQIFGAGELGQLVGGISQKARGVTPLIVAQGGGVFLINLRYLPRGGCSPIWGGKKLWCENPLGGVLTGGKNKRGGGKSLIIRDDGGGVR